MKKKLLLWNVLFLSVGCSGGGSQIQLETDPGILGAPPGQRKNADAPNPEKKDIAAESSKNTNDLGAKNEGAITEAKAEVLKAEPVKEDTEILAVSLLAVDSNEIFPRLPEPEYVGIQSATRTRDEMIFHTKFFLPQQELNPVRTLVRHEFFAWPQVWGSTTIQSASYSHRVLRNGEWLGNFRPKPVWYDHVHRRWFIPFFDIFQNSDFYSAREAHLEDLQVIVLDLLLESGRRITYQIKFQVVGPLPEIVFRDLELPPLPDARLLGERVATVGWVVKKEELFNPSHHFLHLWLRPHQLERDAFFLKTYLHSSSFIEQVHSSPIGPVFQIWSSQGELRVSEVRILYLDRNGRESRATEVLTLDPEKWQGVSILPGETLVLEWLARTQLGVRDCSLPAAQHLRMTWTSLPQQIMARSVSRGKQGAVEAIMSGINALSEESKVKPELPITGIQDVTQEWSILSAEISGRWSRDLLIAFSFLSKEEATQRSLVSSLEEGHVSQPSWAREIAMGLVESLTPGGAPRGGGSFDSLQFSCQGVLR